MLRRHNTIKALLVAGAAATPSFGGASPEAMAHGNLNRGDAGPAVTNLRTNALTSIGHMAINPRVLGVGGLKPKVAGAETHITEEPSVIKPSDGTERVTIEMIEKYTGLATRLAIARFVPTPEEDIFQPLCVGEREIRILPAEVASRPQDNIGTSKDQLKPQDMRTSLPDPAKTIIVAAGRHLTGTCTTDYLDIKKDGPEGDNELCTTVVEEEMHKTGIRTQEPGRGRIMPYPLSDVYHDIYDTDSPIYIDANSNTIPDCLARTIDLERNTTDSLADIFSREKMAVYRKAVASEDDELDVTCETVRTLESICYTVNERNKATKAGRYIQFKSYYTSVGEIQTIKKPEFLPRRVLSKFTQDGKHAITKWLKKQRVKKAPTTRQ